MREIVLSILLLFSVSMLVSADAVCFDEKLCIDTEMVAGHVIAKTDGPVPWRSESAAGEVTYIIELIDSHVTADAFVPFEVGWRNSTNLYTEL